MDNFSATSPGNSSNKMDSIFSTITSKVLVHRDKLIDNENFKKSSQPLSNIPQNAKITTPILEEIVMPSTKNFLEENRPPEETPPKEIPIPTQVVLEDVIIPEASKSKDQKEHYQEKHQERTAENNSNATDRSKVKIHYVIVNALEKERKASEPLYSVLRSIAVQTKSAFEDGMVYLINPFVLMKILSEAKTDSKLDITQEDTQKMIKTLFHTAVQRAVVTPHQKGCIALDRLDILRYCEPFIPISPDNAKSIGGNIEEETFETELTEHKKNLSLANAERDRISKQLTNVYFFDRENENKIQELREKLQLCLNTINVEREWFEQNKHRRAKHSSNISFGLVGITLTENIKEILRNSYSSIVNDSGFLVDGDLVLEDFLVNDLLRSCFAEYTAIQYRLKLYANSGRNPIYMENDSYFILFLREFCFNRITAKTQEELMESPAGGRLKIDEAAYYENRADFERKIAAYTNRYRRKNKKKLLF